MSPKSKATRLATTQSTRQHPLPENFAAMVAEAAYYLAEQRGFCPGCELDDWLAAEARLRERMKDA